MKIDNFIVRIQHDGFYNGTSSIIVNENKGQKKIKINTGIDLILDDNTIECKVDGTFEILIGELTDGDGNIKWINKSNINIPFYSERFIKINGKKRCLAQIVLDDILFNYKMNQKYVIYGKLQLNEEKRGSWDNFNTVSHDSFYNSLN
ncbi:hypothetical protein NRK67_12090 [Fusobacteria bacterium ZRK30]|nr:hypothetical protein NRK67_12090 [Fusobacteria bacterium ZRK30]